MGMDSRNEDLPLPPVAMQKFQELVALMADAGFGTEGPSRNTDFATIEKFGHQAGRMLGRAIDEQLVARHARHFQEEACPTCETAVCAENVESNAPEQEKARPLQTLDGTIPLVEPACDCPKCVRTFFPSAERVAD